MQLLWSDGGRHASSRTSRCQIWLTAILRAQSAPAYLVLGVWREQGGSLGLRALEGDVARALGQRQLALRDGRQVVEVQGGILGLPV